MDASLYVAKTGLNAQQTRMTVIANNLANVNTIGYKKDRAVKVNVIIFFFLIIAILSKVLTGERA